MGREGVTGGGRISELDTNFFTQFCTASLYRKTAPLLCACTRWALVFWWRRRSELARKRLSHSSQWKGLSPATKFHMQHYKFDCGAPPVHLSALLTRVASQVLREVSVLLELFPANSAWKFSIRIINARRVRGGAITLRQHEVSICLLVAGEVGVGQESFFTYLAVIRSLP